MLSSYFNIPSDFQFKCWKHHKEFLKYKIFSVTPQDNIGFKIFLSSIKLIGNSQIDLYVGLLSPNDICEELKILLFTY